MAEATKGAEGVKRESKFAALSRIIAERFSRRFSNGKAGRENEKKTPAAALQERLRRGDRVLLSGGCGTEISRRGVKTEIPLWSASALLTNPEVVKEIHTDYLDAGAEVITTNTFRSNPRTFRKAGLDERQSHDATVLAVRLAREARTESGRDEVAIGGSVAPVEDCYSPELTPSDDELRKEHAQFAAWLKEGGVDFLLIETMPTIREAVIAAEAARAAGLPFMVSFVCDTEGNLLSGEPIEDAIKALVPLGPMALLTNCRPPEKIEKSVDRLLAASPVPVGVYANGHGEPDHATHGWSHTHDHPEESYAQHVDRWLGKGVQIVGGCCGTTPEYTRRMKKSLPVA